MKKVLLVGLLFVALFVTACSSSKGGSSNGATRTPEEMLDAYTKAYVEADVETIKSLIPKFYVDYSPESYSKEQFNKGIENLKSQYGTDFHVTYKLESKTKVTDEELEKLNNNIKNFFKVEDKASECYKLEGTITFTGSKFEDTDPLIMGYCKFDGSWYLIDD